RKIRPLEKIDYRLAVTRIRARYRFPYHPRCRPCLHVQRRHATRIEFEKSILHLHGAPLIVGRVPTLPYKAGRSRDRPRVPCPVGQIGGADPALVRRDKYIIGWRLLCEERHLTLHQSYAAVGSPRAAGIFEYPFLHDLCAETRRRTAQRLCEEPVFI